eukprot:2679027-Amphidinium_carterae.1
MGADYKRGGFLRLVYCVVSRYEVCATTLTKRLGALSLSPTAAVLSFTWSIAAASELWDPNAVCGAQGILWARQGAHALVMPCPLSAILFKNSVQLRWKAHSAVVVSDVSLRSQRVV